MYPVPPKIGTTLPLFLDIESASDSEDKVVDVLSTTQHSILALSISNFPSLSLDDTIGYYAPISKKKLRKLEEKAQLQIN